MRLTSTTSTRQWQWQQQRKHTISERLTVQEMCINVPWNECLRSVQLVYEMLFIHKLSSIFTLALKYTHTVASVIEISLCLLSPFSALLFYRARIKRLSSRNWEKHRCMNTALWIFFIYCIIKQARIVYVSDDKNRFWWIKIIIQSIHAVTSFLRFCSSTKSLPDRTYTWKTPTHHTSSSTNQFRFDCSTLKPLKCNVNSRRIKSD